MLGGEIMKEKKKQKNKREGKKREMIIATNWPSF